MGFLDEESMHRISLFYISQWLHSPGPATMMPKQPWRAPAQDFLKAALAILGSHQELIFLTRSVQEGIKLSTTDGSKKIFFH